MPIAYSAPFTVNVIAGLGLTLLGARNRHATDGHRNIDEPMRSKRPGVPIHR